MAPSPYSEMVFFVQNAAVNLTWRGDPNDPAQDGDVPAFDGSCEAIVWRSEPKRYVYSFKAPAGWSVKNGELREGRDRSEHYVDFLRDLNRSASRADHLKRLRIAKREEDDRFQELVQEWKAKQKPWISFDRWRSGTVGAITEAWKEAGRGTAPFWEKERSWREAEAAGS